MGKYYIYAHFNSDGEVFYIGRGTGGRARQKTNRGVDWYKVADKGYSAEIIKSCLTLEQANTLEEGMILSLKESLVNKNPPVRKIDLCYKELSEYFEYNENSPSCLVRIKKMPNNIGLRGTLGNVGFKSNFGSNKKYWRLKHKNKTIMVHRIIWVLHNQQDLPINIVVDHVNGDSLDNRIENLRACSITENNQNRRLSCNSSTGANGVTWSDDGRYRVGININGKRTTRTFNPTKLYPDLPPEEAKQKTFEDAVTFRKQMEELYYNKPEQ